MVSTLGRAAANGAAARHTGVLQSCCYLKVMVNDFVEPKAVVLPG